MIIREEGVIKGDNKRLNMFIPLTLSHLKERVQCIIPHLPLQELTISYDGDMFSFLLGRCDKR